MFFLRKDSELWDNLATSYSKTVRDAAHSYNWYHHELVPRILDTVKSKKQSSILGVVMKPLLSRLQIKAARLLATMSQNK
jgi:hypothetical protein